MRAYQIAYKTSGGKIHYQSLTYAEGIAYKNLSSDEERAAFIKDRIQHQKIVDGLNTW